jgi:hypothetical protein
MVIAESLPVPIIIDIGQTWFRPVLVWYPLLNIPAWTWYWILFSFANTATAIGYFKKLSHQSSPGIETGMKLVYKVGILRVPTRVAYK